MRRRIFQLLSATILVSGLIAASLLCARLVEKERQELRSHSETEVQSVAIQLRAGVLQSVDSLSGLAKWWIRQGKPFDLDDWRTDGQLFLTRVPSLQEAIWIGRDGLQHWSARPGSPPRTSVTHPAPDLAALLPIAKVRGLAVSDILPAAGGRATFYACMPVEGRKGEFVAGLFDATTLVATITDRSIDPKIRIAVSSHGKTIYSQFAEHLPAGGRVGAAFDIASNPWTVSVGVPQRHINWFTGQIAAIVFVIGALLYSFAILLYLAHSRTAALERANAEVLELNRILNRKVADFETLLDVIPIGIAVAHDPECSIITVNPALAALTGAAADVSRSGPASAVLPYRFLRDGKELQPHELPMHVAAATGKSVRADEEQIVCPDGRVVDILSFAAPLFDEDGRVRGVLNACVDISDRKAQEQLRSRLARRLHRHERMKSLGVMAAGIAHDFNNLLTTIIGQASLAIDRLPAGTAARDHIASSLESAQNAAALVRQVMAYTGHSHHSLRPIHLSSIVKACTGSFPSVRVNFEPAVPPVMADPDETRQAIQNVLSNAIEAAEHVDVQLTVDTCELSVKEADAFPSDQNVHPGHYVRVKVIDTGAGMPSEIADHAFDPFFSTKFLGRGLGLSEVLGIMRSHGGAVRLRSVPDSGTTVELFFPVEKRAERAA